MIPQSCSIILSPSELSAALAGRLSQIRRPCHHANPRGVRYHPETGEREEVPDYADAVCQCAADGSWIAWWGSKTQESYELDTRSLYLAGGGFRCLVGEIGTRLVVKETYALTPTTAYGYLPHRRNPANEWESAVYKEGWERCRPGIWRSPATMPAWASRLTLTVTGVGMERAQGITVADARACGISEYLTEYREGVAEAEDDVWRNRSSIENFAAEWDAQYAAKGFGWETDCWTWVVSVRKEGE